MTLSQKGTALVCVPLLFQLAFVVLVVRSQRDQVAAEGWAFLAEEERLDRERADALDRSRARFYTLLAAGGVAAVACTLGLAYAFRRGVARRFAALVGNARRLAAGEALPPPPAGGDEVDALGREFYALAGELTRASESIRDLYDNAPCGYHSVGPDGVFVAVNRTELRWLGYEAAEVVGLMRFADIISPASREAYQRGFALVREHGSVAGVELELVRKDGTTFPVLVGSSSVRDAAGRYVRSRTTLTDLTEHKRAEDEVRRLNVELEERVRTRTAELDRAHAALREEEELFRGAFDNTNVAMVLTGLDNRFIRANAAFARLFGYTPEEAQGLGLADVTHPDHLGESLDRREGLLAGAADYFHMEKRYRHRDGRVIWGLTNVALIRGPDGRPLMYVGQVQDVTERKAAEEAVRAERDRFARVAAVAPGAIYSFLMPATGPWSMPYASPGLADIYGLRPDDVADDVAPLLARIHPDDRDRVLAANAAAARDMAVWHCEFRVLHPAKGEIWVEGKSAPSPEPDGGVLWHGVLTEVTDRRRAEERLRHAVASSPAVLFTLAVDAGGVRGVEWVSGNLRDLFGYDPAEAFAPSWWADRVHPDDRAGEVPTALLAVGRSVREYRFRHGDGGYRWVRDELRLVRDAAGRSVKAVGSWSDVTERRQVEDQLRQAQKMEAVGQLAGGVAHDFNNLLTIINGYTDILMEAAPPGDPSWELLDEVRKAGERSAGLTRQLLAFSRQQVLAPRVLDLNAVVADTASLLRRVIGEDVRLAAAPARDLWPVKADPGQVEQLLLNLAVNARDAMPTGGKLTIETANVELDEGYAAAHPDARQGPHVLLAVSDTGCGMPPEIVARIFEPFFTTKGVGKGTGLGLATVYGIVKQSGGHLAVYSEVGIGTTFKVYLPRAEPGGAAAAAPARAPAAPRGTERVLVVEDEDAVRALTRRVLRQAGYAVVDAADAAAAVRAAEGHRIDLLVTDVVMPGAGGPELAGELAGRHPGLRVLFVSGYTDDALVRHGVLHERVHFLQKPFTPAALAHKVREVLDAPAG